MFQFSLQFFPHKAPLYRLLARKGFQHTRCRATGICGRRAGLTMAISIPRMGMGLHSPEIPPAMILAVSRIAGYPPNLSGSTLATNVGSNWAGSSYNRKPTGMVCIGGAIYLAFQNLNLTTFGDAPAASIAKSTDHGSNWTWDSSAPMFEHRPIPRQPQPTSLRRSLR